jgi:hypothetical protein
VSAIAPIEAVPWQQLEGETVQAYHGFMHFRDLPGGKEKTFTDAYREHMHVCRGRSAEGAAKVILPGTWQRWVDKFRWRERAATYAGEIEEAKLDGLKSEATEVGRRHAQMAASALEALHQPVLAIGRVMAKDPESLAALCEAAEVDPKALLGLVQIARESAASMPALAKMEREALGVDETREERHIVDIHVKYDDEFSL